MKHLTIIVPDGENNLSSIIGAYKIFSRANVYWKAKSRKELFKIELAGISKKINFYDGLFSVKPHTHVSAITKTHLIVIPSLNHNYQKAIKGNQLLIDWIEQQYKNGAEVVSICTGAFLLASSGLLNGKTCSTHWAFADTFRNMFPKVNLQTDRLITDENGIYTNGGAYSFLNLIIYLVEKYFDRQTAIFCSKVFQIEMDRQSQSPFIILQDKSRTVTKWYYRLRPILKTIFAKKYPLKICRPDSRSAGGILTEDLSKQQEIRPWNMPSVQKLKRLKKLLRRTEKQSMK